MYNSAMEMANEKVALYRRVRPTDEGELRLLLEQAQYGYRFVDWNEPGDWLDSPAFIVAEQKQSNQEQLSSCLKVSREVPPAAWVRLAAVRDHTTAKRQLSELFLHIIPHLLLLGVNQVGWLAATGWPEELLKDVGFEISNWITSYQKVIQPNPPKMSQEVTLRPAALGDVSALTDIEFKAFEPIWRLSKLSLENAFRQAVSYDAAVIDGRVVGFQFSARGYNHRSAHLVRITVHPEFQGRGVGSALLTRAMAGYLEQGIEFVSLNTQINNIASHRLYERFGFTKVGDQIPLYMYAINKDEG